VTTSDDRAMTRAPAVFFVGTSGQGSDELPVYFRLPSPPLLERARHAWALERRAKKIYFAVLDAMSTGHLDPEHMVKLARLLADVSTRSATLWLRQLQRAAEAAARAGSRAPLLPQPSAPLTELIAVPVLDDPRQMMDESVWKELAWPLEWLRTRGYVVSKGLQFQWQAPRQVHRAVWSELREALLLPFGGGLERLEGA